MQGPDPTEQDPGSYELKSQYPDYYWNYEKHFDEHTEWAVEDQPEVTV